METPLLTPVALEEIYIVPVEVAEALAAPILDEDGRIIRDETGLSIYEG